MKDLVFWSFMIALTPWALGLAWWLISGVEEFVWSAHSRAFEETGQGGPPGALGLDPLSSSGSMAGRASRPGVGRF
jgi:hypothetical protein